MDAVIAVSRAELVPHLEWIQCLPTVVATCSQSGDEFAKFPSFDWRICTQPICIMGLSLWWDPRFITRLYQLDIYLAFNFPTIIRANSSPFWRLSCFFPTYLQVNAWAGMTEEWARRVTTAHWSGHLVRVPILVLNSCLGSIQRKETLFSHAAECCGWMRVWELEVETHLRCIIGTEVNLFFQSE